MNPRFKHSGAGSEFTEKCHDINGLIIKTTGHLFKNVIPALILSGNPVFTSIFWIPDKIIRG